MEGKRQPKSRTVEGREQISEVLVQVVWGAAIRKWIGPLEAMKHRGGCP